MGHNTLITHKERERVGLLQLAREIVEAGLTRGRALSRGEDGMVTELVRQAQVLESEIKSLRKDQQRVTPSNHKKTEDGK